MSYNFSQLVFASAFSAVVAVVALGAQPQQVLDDFSDAGRWDVVASEGVSITCRSERLETAPRDRRVLRLDYDFESGAGYAGIRRELPIDLPPNFQLAFSIRGDLQPNNLELKLVDESGDNVWWVNRRRFEFPRDWQQLASRRRHLQFAWGPSNAPIKRVKAIELVVASAEGGRGTVYLDDLTFRVLPETKPYSGTPTVTATSTAANSSPSFASDGDGNTVWKSASSEKAPRLTIDFGSPREFGGLAVQWDPGTHAARYTIQSSDDGERWEEMRQVRTANGRPQYISLPDSEARALRFWFEGGAPYGTVGVSEIEVLPLEAAGDANALAELVARRAPRGHYPRAFTGEGTFWTVIGPSEGDREALVSEDGAVEVDKQCFSIEPFVEVGDRLLTWADAESTQSLAAGHAPIPTIARQHEDLKLEVTAFADGQEDATRLYVLYDVTNTVEKTIHGRLLLALRPFQVNPPYQWLNATGGTARVDQIAIRESGRRVSVDQRDVFLGLAPTTSTCAEYDEGDAVLLVANGLGDDRSEVHDPQRAASGVAAYEFDLSAGEKGSWVVCVPLTTEKAQIDMAGRDFLALNDPVAYVRQRKEVVADEWTNATSTFDLIVPQEFSEVVATIRSTLAYILINRDGPSIQPGSRSYERSWIRDGSLTSTALLRFGLPAEARDFVDWYAPFQFESGKIPCVVDRRGPDAVPENDSHGQYIMAVMSVYRFTNDREFLDRHWPRVQRAVAYIEQLRRERQTAEFSDPHTKQTRQEPAKPPVSAHAFYGLMPESISHEGYSAKPMHSYWDDFFTLRGLKDAAALAAIIGDKDIALRYDRLADDFANTLYSSIRLAQVAHGIAYIPGCVELGDFDATSTTVALWPCGEFSRLPRPAIDETFDLYWDRFVKRRDDPGFAWKDYTPYELRCIGSMVLLGHPDRAREAVKFFMQDRSPPAWNQWPEIVYREPRTAKFLGDLPHTWCGSDFLNSVRLMFLWEHDEEDAIVLLAGVPSNWISEDPVGFRDMPTYGGRLTCKVSREGNDGLIRAELAGTAPVPRGGYRLTVPQRIAEATVNQKPADLDSSGRVIIRELPASVVIDLVL